MITQLSTKEEILFRQVQLSDAPTLICLMEQLGYPIDKSSMEENIQNYLKLSHQKAWVAEMSGQVMGCIAVAKTHFFHRPGCFLRIITMVVDENARRLGIGKKLVEMAEKYASEQGCTHVELTSGVHRAKLGAHQFYLSLGYTDLVQSKKYFGKLL